MEYGRSDADFVRETHNVARYFTERRAIAWVALIAVTVWGAYGYVNMPKRKDPEIPVRIALAVTNWPGVSAEKVEQLVTRPIEERIAENTSIHPPTASAFGIKSISLPGVSIVQIQLDESVDDVRKEFSDINLKLNALNSQLPQGAGPIQFNSDFGDTAALMLTVASPPETPVAIALRADAIRRVLTEVRARAPPGPRVAVVVSYAGLVSPDLPLRSRDQVARYLVAQGIARDVRPLDGPGFAGLDMATDLDDTALGAVIERFAREVLGAPRIHPDAWAPAIIRDPAETEAKLATVAGPRYTYRELDDATDIIQRALERVPLASTVSRSGVLNEQITLVYSQARLAAYGLQPSNLKNILGARNITLAGGVLNVDNLNVTVDPSGEFKNAREIGGVIITRDANGNAVYLRDLVDIVRTYQSPPNYLNYYTWKDASGQWHRTPAITLSVQMRSSKQIAEFGQLVDAALAEVAPQLPPDLVMARTSDQPRQVRENIDLFMTALYEAIILVVVISLVGFWEWRSALLIALSIPITLAMTFGAAFTLGIELQQVSIATLIIALGLLVDDPVVAGDAIKRELGAGQSRQVAAWLGPTKIAQAILFATITNIVAYLPYLLLTGTTGDFLYSLPVVMTCALVSSRLASMTFVPLLGYYLLRTPKRLDPPIEERRRHGFTGVYYRVGVKVLKHRWISLAVSCVFLVAGGAMFSRLPTSFFPDDVQYLSYIDLWLPNNVSFARTDAVAERATQIVREVAAEYAAANPGKDGRPRPVLKSVTTFVGGGAPRFWFSLTPEQRQNNYAQLVIEVEDKFDTPPLADRLRPAIAARLDGARADVRQLETNAVGIPIQIRLSTESGADPQRSQANLAELRRLGDRLTAVFRDLPIAAGFRDDWGEESFVVKLAVDPDRANLAGVTNQDVAGSASAGISGSEVTVLREGDKQIPVVAQLQFDERANLSDVQNLYVYSASGTQNAPLGLVASVHTDLETQRIQRMDHYRTITVEGFPAGNAYPSQVMNAARPALTAFEKSLPPGFQVTISGAEAKQKHGFRQLGILLAISVAAIFVSLVIQFNHAAKPLLVFAAVPYGAVGAVAALWIMGAPFSFMAFLGITSLVGVIVSHVIVLFDFIEENRVRGEPLQDSLLDAGIVRLRPVMITVLATMFALVPLAIHGGPLWQPLCFAQIGGLALATFIELLLVKVFYVIFVLDLKIVKWDAMPGAADAAPTAASAPG
jgi:multidrug efflux pump subunit AcrB